MDKPVMFNGRLTKDEVDTWLELLNRTGESGYKDRGLARSFLQLEDSITFVSSLEDKIIGGTSIYKDKTRLAMVLTSVVVDKQYRESATYQIVKSSLPFFKTVAIRDVDALVAHDIGLNNLGFPLSLELDPWVEEVIKRMGFEEVGILEHCNFEIIKKPEKNPLEWSRNRNPNQIKEHIWDQSKALGLTNSFVWTAYDFAYWSNRLWVVVIENQMNAVAGFWQLADTLCISPFIFDSEILSWEQVAKSLVAEARQRHMTRIDLPLIGDGQKELIRALEKWCKSSYCRKLSLLRKPL
jgi:N-acetylglutamate synthase-like GNAT family acetyltransferase